MNKPKIDTSKLSVKLPEAQEAQEATAQKEEALYQHYSSARVSTQLITTKGKKIKFNNYEFITSDQDCIDYLDDEIKQGIKSITKGKLLTESEANPKERLKREIIAEYLAEQAATQDPTRDLGKTAGASTVSPAPSKLVAN